MLTLYFWKMEDGWWSFQLGSDPATMEIYRTPDFSQGMRLSGKALGALGVGEGWGLERLPDSKVGMWSNRMSYDEWPQWGSEASPSLSEI